MGIFKPKRSEAIPASVDDNDDGFADLAETRRFAGNPSRSTLWRWCRDGSFPKPDWIGPNRRAWRRRVLREWAKDPRDWAVRNRQQRTPAEQEAGDEEED